MCLPARPLVSTGRGVREEGEWAVVEGSGVGQTGLSRMLHSFILAKVLLLFFLSLHAVLGMRLYLLK